MSRLAPGQPLEETLILTDFSLANYASAQRQGQRYLRLSFLGPEGRLEGRLWDGWEEILAGLVRDGAYQVRGQLSVFNGSLQLNVQGLTSLPAGSVDLSGFQPGCPIPLEPLIQEFEATWERISKPTYRILLAALFDDQARELFYRATAATKHHHAYRGGLLHHTVEVLRLAEAALVLPGAALDADLLRAGAILHDFGKLDEYDHDSPSFRRRERTRLVGTHVLLGAQAVQQKAAGLALNLPAGDLDRLVHLILSHHGTAEWGSPVVPTLPEAVALHQADLFSTRLNQANSGGGNP